jgi:hypothetical protein
VKNGLVSESKQANQNIAHRQINKRVEPGLLAILLQSGLFIFSLVAFGQWEATDLLALCNTLNERENWSAVSIVCLRLGSGRLRLRLRLSSNL